MALTEIIDNLENTKDELLDDVISFFADSEQQITISLIQRKFQLGYNRANRIVRQMEKELLEKRNSLKRELLSPILTGKESNISIPEYSQKRELIEKQLSQIRSICL